MRAGIDRFDGAAGRGPRRRGWRRAGLLVMIATGCAGDSDAANRLEPASGTARSVIASAAPLPGTSRTENGVTIVEHGADAFDRAPRFTLDSVPLAVMGGQDEPADFDLTRVSQVVLLRDGRVATFAGIGARLLLFAADGTPGRVLGRRGRGPREFWAPTGITLLAADTLLIRDGANRRLSWVTPDSGVVEEIPLSGNPLAARGSPGGALRDGRVIVHALYNVAYGESADTVFRPLGEVGVLDPASGAVTPLASLPGHELATRETRYRGRRSNESTVLGFGRGAHAVALDTVVATAIGDGYTVDFRTPDGTIVRRIVVDQPRRAVTQAMRDDFIATALERIERSSGEAMVDPAESRRLTREHPFADSLPPYRGLHASSDNRLWVVDATAFDDSIRAATMFDLNGAILGRLTYTLEGHPMAFGPDRVVLRSRDADDVVTLSVYRIVPVR